MGALNRKLIVPSRHYGLSVPVDKQAQREVIVLVGMIGICAVQFYSHLWLL